MADQNRQILLIEQAALQNDGAKFVLDFGRDAHQCGTLPLVHRKNGTFPRDEFSLA
jgi:hypothetical protein